MSSGLDPKAMIKIGLRLRAYRETRGFTPEEMAERLGISRAALYRVEKGDIAKIEVLGRIATELDSGLDQLLGQGAKFYDNAPALFARMGELEAKATHVVGVFSPISYLLTTPDYDGFLEKALYEQNQGDSDQIALTMATLRLRRQRFLQNKYSLHSIVTVPDLERFLREGLTSRSDLDEATMAARRAHAFAEVEAIAARATAANDRIQLRLVETPGPATSFQIFEVKGGNWMVSSPFALGPRPNISLGIGLASPLPDAIAAHRAVVERLWDEGLSGAAAAGRIHELLKAAKG